MDVMRKPGVGIGWEIARGEAVEDELTRLVERRHERRVTGEGERPAEAAWAESERRHSALRSDALRAEWCEYHREQAERHRRNLAALVDHHEAAAERLMREGAA